MTIGIYAGCNREGNIATSRSARRPCVAPSPQSLMFKPIPTVSVASRSGIVVAAEI
jgi:hypothetical protein